MVNKEIESNILSVLTAIPDSQLQDVATKLVDVGVSSVEDLKHVVETDLLQVLKPIQIRKLLFAWSVKGDKW